MAVYEIGVQYQRETLNIIWVLLGLLKFCESSKDLIAYQVLRRKSTIA